MINQQQHIISSRRGSREPGGRGEAAGRAGPRAPCRRPAGGEPAGPDRGPRRAPRRLRARRRLGGGRARAGLPRPRRGGAARVSAQVGAGGAVWTAPRGRAGRAARGRSPAGHARAGFSERTSASSSSPLLTCLQIPRALCSFPRKVWGYARACHWRSRRP